MILIIYTTWLQLKNASRKQQTIRDKKAEKAKRAT